MSAALDHLADRVKTDPWFLAHPLAEYARSAGLDDAALAAHLGCAAADLAAVRLCRAPRADDFRADLTAVATRFNLNLPALAAAVQQGQAVAHVRVNLPQGTDAGVAIAARDRDEPEPGG